ncbi:hypothetical protein E1A91_D04G010500v1 [Gossypium mustelinum]|uniref:Methyltransferase type 12 domain-containing protein n=1 Tax=Gossypium mustelinum TaxID=34275 RepID=A0A5D2V8N5_GOSMU|nr:hypothetical protein E1A91_D04G010500v1 [Gossypium mustelinum]
MTHGFVRWPFKLLANTRIWLSTTRKTPPSFGTISISAIKTRSLLLFSLKKNNCKANTFMFWFFKDRHYLEKDWGQYFSDDANSANVKVLLEVGCGAGNTIFPLIAAYPELYVQACDISPHAIALVKSHAEFKEDRVNAFLCDVTVDNLLERINPSSVDVITLIFMLSAVSPHKMPSILQNIKRVLKPDGYVLLRDYAIGDFAQVKLENKNQMISEGFYVRGDGTCSFYFSEDFLSTLFFQAGFNTVDISTYCKQIKNSHKNITMDRRWVRAVFKNLE